jgi:hypothetical protein
MRNRGHWRQRAAALIGVVTLAIAACGTDPGADSPPYRPPGSPDASGPYETWARSWEPPRKAWMQTYAQLLSDLKDGSITTASLNEHGARMTTASHDLAASLTGVAPPPSPPTATNLMAALADALTRAERASEKAARCAESACVTANRDLVGTSGRVLDLLTRPSPDMVTVATSSPLDDALLTGADIPGAVPVDGQRPEVVDSLCVPTFETSNAIENVTPAVATRTSRLEISEPFRRVLQNVLRFPSASGAAQYVDTLAVRAATCPAFSATGSNSDQSEYTRKWSSLGEWRRDIPVVGWRQTLTQADGSGGSGVAGAARVGDTVVLVSVIAVETLDDDAGTHLLDLMLSRLGVPMPTASPAESATDGQ